MILWLLLVALVLPAPAAEEYARYDLQLNRLMLGQAAVALEAGGVVENWQRGQGAATNAAALASLDSLLKKSEALTREVERLKPPTSAKALHAAAARAARGRTDLIRLARAHVAQGNPTGPTQTAFMGQNLTATSELQARWISDRLEAARSAPVQGARLREFYEWQTQMLSLTRTQVKVGSDVQKLVFASSGSSANLPALIQQAGEATVISFEIRDKAKLIQPPAALAEAHLKAREEQAALSQLCAEIKAYTGDRSDETRAHVVYSFRELREASQAAERASLEALAAALNSR